MSEPQLQTRSAPDGAFIWDLTTLCARELGEDPDLNPATLLSRSHSEYDEATSLRAMLEADLFIERIAIESYREMVDFVGQRDPTTRRLLESILAREEEHAEDLVDLLEDLPKD